MSRFSSEREAKEYLVGEIAREAERQGRPLSEIEQKMLYFSESGWTLPDMAKVAETFEQQFDSIKYERRIGGLARSAHKHMGKAGAASWSEAVKRLERGDHYLLVMVGHAGRRKPGELTWREAVAVILIILGLGVIRPLLLERVLGHDPTKDDTVFFTWAAMVVLTAIYLVVCFVIGRKRVEDWLSRAIMWFARGKRT